MKLIKEKIIKPAVPAKPAVVKKTVKEVENEGLMALIGKRVTLFCNSYFYTGTLVGVNVSCVKLSDAGIVYETGNLTEGEWTDMQPLPGDWYVQIAAIESFGILK